MKTIVYCPRSIKYLFNEGLKYLVLLILFCFFTQNIYSQSDSLGAIKIKLVDKDSKEAIPFANIVIYNQKGLQVNVGTTNMEGEVILRVREGLYNVKAVYVGYQANTIKDVKVEVGKTSFVTIDLNSGGGVHLNSVEVISYQIPLMDPNYTSGTTITKEDYQNLAVKDINSSIATSAGVFKRRMKKNAEHKPVDHGRNYYANSERYEESAENKFKKSTHDPLSTFASDIDVASYANIRRLLNQGQLPPKEAVRIEEMVNYFRYQYAAPANEQAFSIHNEISTCPWNKKHRLLQIGIQGRTVEFKDAKPNYLTFLIDVSGSTQTPEKLPLLKDALNMLVKQLRDIDKVAIVVYAGNAGLVLSSTSGEHKNKILEAIAELEAGGSTAGGEGIVLAYDIAKKNYSNNANNRVILATDGDFNVGVSDDESLVKMIEEKRDAGIFLTVLGLGSGNYQDAKMEKLADKGNGNYAYIDNLLEAKKVLVKEIGGTLITIAKDLKIQIEFNPKYVKSYRLIGYDNRMLAHEDFKNDKKDAGDIGSGHSVTALYEIIPSDNEAEEQEVDDLKYQQKQITEAASGNEICTVKLRYKEPKESKSKEMSAVVKDTQVDLENTSTNFKFCAAVAELGLILRQSEFKGKANYQDVIQLAKVSKGEDEEGYRAEFIRMCEMSETLANR